MSDTATPPTTALPGSMTLREAEATHALLSAAIATNSAVVVDCSAAEDVDLSHVQLLIAAQRSAAACGKSFSLSTPAAGALLDALIRGGFVDPASPDEAFWTSRSPHPR